MSEVLDFQQRGVAVILVRKRMALRSTVDTLATLTPHAARRLRDDLDLAIGMAERASAAEDRRGLEKLRADQAATARTIAELEHRLATQPQAEACASG